MRLLGYMIVKVPFNLYHLRNVEFSNLCLLQNYLLAFLKCRGLGPTSRLRWYGAFSLEHVSR